MSNAISAQGTLVERAPQATPTAFVVIDNMMDVTPPSLARNALETTSHNDIEEAYVMGIRRKGTLGFSLGWLQSGASHGIASGLVKAWIDNDRSIWRITYPDNSKIVFSGFVSNIAPSAPVDDVLMADVEVRPTGTATFA